MYMNTLEAYRMYRPNLPSAASGLSAGSSSPSTTAATASSVIANTVNCFIMKDSTARVSIVCVCHNGNRPGIKLGRLSSTFIHKLTQLTSH